MVEFICGAILGGVFAFMSMWFYEKYDYKKEKPKTIEPTIEEEKEEQKEELKENSKTPFDLVDDILNGDYNLDDKGGE